MVVGAILNKGTAGTDFYVGRNRAFLDNGDFSDYNLSDAAISIEKLATGELLEDFQEKLQAGATFNYEAIQLATFYEPGEYRFRVEHPSYPVSETVLEFPKKGTVENFEFRYESGSDLEGNPTSKLSFDVIDEAGVDNYYTLSIEIDGRTLRLSTLDISSAEGNDSRNLLFSDETFDGERKRIDVRFDRFFWNPNVSEEIIVSWTAVNEGFFLLSKTLELQQITSDNPFSAEVQVFSNVNDALGVIGFRNTVIDTIRP